MSTQPYLNPLFVEKKGTSFLVMRRLLLMLLAEDWKKYLVVALLPYLKPLYLYLSVLLEHQNLPPSGDDRQPWETPYFPYHSVKNNIVKFTRP